MSDTTSEWNLSLQESHGVLKASRRSGAVMHLELFLLEAAPLQVSVESHFALDKSPNAFACLPLV